MGDGETIEVRRERPGDEPAIERVNDEAFGQPDESRIVAAVREAGRATISLVAVDGASIVGHILFTPVTLEPPKSGLNVLGLGPMAVLPRLQRRGIGSKLAAAGLQECARAGCHAVVVIGHPEFYPRFGFRPARKDGLECEYGVADEAFMVVELVRGALAGYRGLVRYCAEFGSE